MANKKTRRYAAAAARASQGYRQGPARNRTTSRRTSGGGVVHTSNTSPSRIERDTRSESARISDARNAMKGRTSGSPSVRTYSDAVGNAVRKRTAAAGRAVRKATTGSAGKGSNSRASRAIKKRSKTRKATASRRVNR